MNPLEALREPLGPPRPRRRVVAILIGLALSAAAALGGTLLMPESYSWRANVISESAAQGVSGAWLARLGFLLFGISVLWLAASARDRIGRGAIWCHVAFALFMFGTAAFSHRPWLPDIDYDRFEDHLHSITATGMGFAFSFAVVIRLVDRRSLARRLIDVAAIAAAVGLPAAGGLWTGHAGWSQRLMFAIAYCWYAGEALDLRRVPQDTAVRADASRSRIGSSR
jgi:hypothetical protein